MHVSSLSAAFMLHSFLIQETYLWAKREMAHEGGRRPAKEACLPNSRFCGLPFSPMASPQNLEKGFVSVNVSTFVHDGLLHLFTALSARRTSGLLGLHVVDLIREESLG